MFPLSRPTSCNIRIQFSNKIVVRTLYVRDTVSVIHAISVNPQCIRLVVFRLGYPVQVRLRNKTKRKTNEFIFRGYGTHISKSNPFRLTDVFHYCFVCFFFPPRGPLSFPSDLARDIRLAISRIDRYYSVAQLDPHPIFLSNKKERRQA